MMKTRAAWAPADGDRGEAPSGRARATVLTQFTRHPMRRRKGAPHIGGVREVWERRIWSPQVPSVH